MGLTLEAVGGWPTVLGRLVAGESLDEATAAAALGDILAGNATPVNIAAFLTALRCKGETVEEMTGLVRAMLDHAEPVPVTGRGLVDTCGTGGGAQRRAATFNVSTIAAFVAAGAGARVCKHGNRAATSTSGSFDLLEALGVTFDLGPAAVARCIDEVGIGFCFAPRFHPAMRHAGPVRRELGVPTVFNFLGPLANPARPEAQVVGVSNPQMADHVAGVLRANGVARAMVVFGHDGLDELTTTTTSTVVEVTAEGCTRRDVDPTALGLPRATAADLAGGDPARNAELARAVLAGAPGAHRDIVVLNAAAALVVAGVAADLAEGVTAAQRAIDEGGAAATLARLAEVSAAAAGG